MEKRTALFLFGCIGTRLLITFLAMTFVTYLPYMGYLATIISFGFFFFYITGTRKTGIETDGGPIWWNNYRPFHGIMYGIFAYLAINQNKNAWKVLLLDTLIGLFLWTNRKLNIL